MNEQVNSTNQNISTNNNVNTVANTNITPQSVNSSSVQSQTISNSGVVSQPVASNMGTINASSQQQNTGVSPAAMNMNLHSSQGSVPNSTNANNIDNNSNSSNSSNNNNINYKPPGVFKTLLLIIFFGGLVAFIIFLPEIQAFVAEYRSGGTGVEEITSGKLKCNLETNTSNLNKSYERVFSFTDKKLQSAVYTSITKGDITSDESTLDELYNSCKIKKESVLQIDGVTIACDYSDGLLTEREHFNYKEFDLEKVKAAYTEAGVDIIEYEYGYDIDKINTEMLQAGFTCKKE